LTYKEIVLTSHMNSQGARSFGQALHPAAVPPNPRRLRRTGPLSVPSLRASGRWADLDQPAGRGPVPVVGSEAIAERLAGQLATAAGDICWLRCGNEQDGPVLQGVAAAVDASRVRILQHGGHQPAPQALAGAELRVTNGRPGQDFLLVGEDLAFVFDRDEANQLVMTPVPQVSVARAFLGIFEHLWSTALPVATEIQHELGSEARRIIIQMLGDGATDDAISRALGISRRTTARHVARIMHYTGALSRFQAGMRLAQLGLLAGRS
jgi:DNA-binding CsgD family transcriptional regulator